MYSRFCKYLDKDFRFIPGVQEVEELKAEVLGVLMDRADELKASGMTDEDEIFGLCIQSIEGYKETLKALKVSLKLVETAKKTSRVSLAAFLYFIILTGIFLLVSFTVDNFWSKSWIIMADGALAFATGACVLFAIKMRKTGKLIFMRTLLVPVFAILTVIAYLNVSVFIGGVWSKTWIAFLFLPALLLLVDIIAGIAFKSGKLWKAELPAVILLLSVFVYVALAFLGIIAWHPYWLIIVGGLCISSALTVMFINLKKGK